MQSGKVAKLLRFTGFGLSVIAIAAVASAFALEKSLPYRIGPDSYARYLWVDRLLLAAMVISLVAIVVNIVLRQRFSSAIGALALLALIFFLPASSHSGPNPTAWCYFNLRKIDGAKGQLAYEHNLTNGAVITSKDISPYLEGTFASLRCYQGGQYVIGAVGAEPRCSFHGTLSEFDVPANGTNH